MEPASLDFLQPQEFISRRIFRRRCVLLLITNSIATALFSVKLGLNIHFDYLDRDVFLHNKNPFFFFWNSFAKYLVRRDYHTRENPFDSFPDTLGSAPGICSRALLQDTKMLSTFSLPVFFGWTLLRYSCHRLSAALL